MADMLIRESAPPVGYCLRGEIGGMEQVYPLQPGVNQLGSLAKNDIALPANGVSRLHARLKVVDGQLEIEDLGSKNGTFVSGRRIDQVLINPSQAVRFGPVRLTFETYHRDDGELAIAFDTSISEQTGTVPIVQSPAAGLGGTLARGWLRVGELFQLRLLNKSDGDLGAAMGLLVEELHLDGACVLEIPEDEYPIVLAASGQIVHEATDELRRLCRAYLSTGPRPDLTFQTTGETSPPMTLAALKNPGADPLVLVLWGTFPGRVDSEPLLRLLVRMLVPYRPRVETEAEAKRPKEFPGLVFPPDYVYAQSAAMAKIYRLMQTLAMGDLPVLIVGETGVGKEYLAQILHQSSPRRDGPYMAINCAAIPAELLEAELFGIGEGVATGVSAKEGRLQLASGGTILLDEIGDMSADLQAKLLRALQEKEVHPVGRDPVPVDVRVLAATNQDLTRRIASGEFRSDLYYRLAGYMLEIPPLRERPEDVPALVEHFLRRCAKDLGRPIRGLTVHALRLLCEYPWPGNIRELSNEVHRAVYLCQENRTIESSILSPTLREYEAPATDATDPEAAEADAANAQDMPGSIGLGLDSLNLEELENRAVEEALRRCRFNQVQAAKLLGISRQSLRRRMERIGRLAPPAVKQGGHAPRQG
ncbi:MAG: sigma 54-interacting transcriptional regulator [Acidobacteriota bacterium]